MRKEAYALMFMPAHRSFGHAHLRQDGYAKILRYSLRERVSSIKQCVGEGKYYTGNKRHEQVAIPAQAGIQCLETPGVRSLFTGVIVKSPQKDWGHS